MREAGAGSVTEFGAISFPTLDIKLHSPDLISSHQINSYGEIGIKNGVLEIYNSPAYKRSAPQVLKFDQFNENGDLVYAGTEFHQAYQNGRYGIRLTVDKSVLEGPKNVKIIIQREISASQI